MVGCAIVSDTVIAISIKITDSFCVLPRYDVNSKTGLNRNFVRFRSPNYICKMSQAQKPKALIRSPTEMKMKISSILFLFSLFLLCRLHFDQDLSVETPIFYFLDTRFSFVRSVFIYIYAISSVANFVCRQLCVNVKKRCVHQLTADSLSLINQTKKKCAATMSSSKNVKKKKTKRNDDDEEEDEN